MSRDLDINFLPGRIAVEKEPGDHAGHFGRLDDSFESAEQVSITTEETRSAIVSNT